MSLIVNVIKKWGLIFTAILLFFLNGLTDLKNTPTLFFISVGFGSALLILIIMLKKSFLQNFFSSMMMVIFSGILLSSLLSCLFTITIMLFNFENDKIVNVKCKVLKVSRGKTYEYLHFSYNNQEYKTRYLNSEKYKDCNDNCEIFLKIKKKPFNTFYIVDNDSQK